MKGLVYNALICNKTSLEFTISDEEVKYHMHIAFIHHDMPSSKGQDVTAMNQYIVAQCIEQHSEEQIKLEQFYQESMIEALGKMAAYELTKAVQKKMEAFHASRNNQR